MLSQLTIPKMRSVDPALDYLQLYNRGLRRVQDLSSAIWSDYNFHDPGVTALELMCYTLTDLSHRAQLPVADLLATGSDNASNMKAQFFTARRILPNRPLTVLDYRKLLVDLKGIKNAWLQPASLTYFVSTSTGQMFTSNPGTPDSKPVSIRGLYNVLIDITEEDQAGLQARALQTLQANRNLCDDFVRCDVVPSQIFLLCCEVELEPDADVNAVLAQIFFRTEQCLAPPVNNYSLDDMLKRSKPDGTPYTPADIFDGPALECGFIDDNELTKADLTTQIHLSDVIAAIMEIEGVVAVGEIVLNPEPPAETEPAPLPNKWVVPIEHGTKAVLDTEKSRVVLYKKNMPVVADPAKWHAQRDQLVSTAIKKTETVRNEDLNVPLGRFRQADKYSSFQKHFPLIYGLSDFGFNPALPDDQKALAWQLKAYLLFFDQIMADFAAQVGAVRELFSTNANDQQTYFFQTVEFKDSDNIYGASPENTLKDIIETPAAAAERRNRFLEHLIARFAEEFTDFVNTTNSAFGTQPANLIALKCDFLQNYPSISSDRSLAYNYTQTNTWDSENVSGLEKRLAKLLGLQNFTRRDLFDGGEGMYLIENILLRPEPAQATDPTLTACVDPNCKDCADLDPYSYRVHVILPAYAGRFTNMDFRRFVEATIRAEMPAHILPKVCWIDQSDMKDLQAAFSDWIRLKSGEDNTLRQQKLTTLRDKLTSLKNVYPPQKLAPCAEDAPKFILNQTILGTS